MLLGPDALVGCVLFVLGSQLAGGTGASGDSGQGATPWWPYAAGLVLLNCLSMLAEHVWARTVESGWNARCRASYPQHNLTDRVALVEVADLDDAGLREIAAFAVQELFACTGGDALHTVLKEIRLLDAVVLARRGSAISAMVGVQRHAWALRPDEDRSEAHGGRDCLLCNYQPRGVHAPAPDATQPCRACPGGADETWNARMLVVARGSRRQGLGRLVMQCLLHAARRHAVPLVELHVDVDREHGAHVWLCRFYASLGFSVVSKRARDAHLVCLTGPGV